MSDLRYPNESEDYRDARDALLKEEQELADKVKAVAAKRRALPLGGALKQDYVFEWANEGKVGPRSNSPRSSATSPRSSSTLSCTVRTGTTPVRRARR